MDNILLEKAKSVFKNDNFATETTGIEILNVGENYAKCTLKILEKHKNAMGSVMGGAIFTLADFTFAVATNNKELSIVSLSSTISYLNVTHGKILFAEAKCRRSGKKIVFFDIEICDENDVAVAFVSTTGMKINKVGE